MICFRTLFKSLEKARFVEDYLKWRIVELPSFWRQKPSGLLVSVFVAVNSGNLRVITGVDLADLKADINERLRA